MIWASCDFIKNQYTTDPLGNHIPSGEEIVYSTYCRQKAWDIEEIKLYGDVTKAEEQYLAKARYSSVKDAEIFRMGIHDYEIVEMQDLAGRYTKVIVKAYKFT